MRDLTAIDVCCGAGGWAVAARGLPIKIVKAYDLQADCLETYAYNHPGTETVQMDATAIDWIKNRGIDIVLGGIPCETVTPARKNRKNPVSARELASWHALIDSLLEGVEIWKSVV